MDDNHIQVAQQFVTPLAEGDFAAVEQRFEHAVRKQLPAVYVVPGHMAEEVMNDIGRWMLDYIPQYQVR